MEIGDQSVNQLETIARRDKEACRAMIGQCLTCMNAGHALQDAHSRSANGNHASTLAACLENKLGSCFVKIDLLAMHLVFAEILDLDGPEGIKPHMQRDKTHAHTLPAQTVQQAGRKV